MRCGLLYLNEKHSEKPTNRPAPGGAIENRRVTCYESQASLARANALFALFIPDNLEAVSPGD